MTLKNNAYHRASKTVLNWKRLPIEMKARYAHWIMYSDCSWTVNFKLIVTHHNGRKLKEPPVYPFEHKKHAEECERWWKDNNCIAEIVEVA